MSAERVWLGTELGIGLGRSGEFVGFGQIGMSWRLLMDLIRKF